MEKKITKKQKKETKEVKTNSVIKNPRMTEKASILSDKGVYTFNVSVDATKNEIKKAINTLYKVNPTKVAIITIKKKTVFVRGKTGSKAGGKKAMVHLKKGDKITLV